MKHQKNHRKSCLVGHDSTSFSPLLFFVLFLFFAFGPIGPLVALSIYLLLGHLIVALPKMAGRVQSAIGRMPMWGVGLTLATTLAVVGFGYASLPCKYTKAINPVRTRIVQTQPFVIEETHSGDADSCIDCSALLRERDPDITQWQQSKESHIVTLTIFAPNLIPQVTNNVKRVKFNPAQIFHDELHKMPAFDHF